MIKFNITVMGQGDVYILSKTGNFNHKNEIKRIQRGAFYKTAGLYSSKMSISFKTKIAEELFRNEED